MDKNSKILITVFVLIALASIFFTYKRAFMDKDFEVINSEEEEVAGEETEETEVETNIELEKVLE